MPIKLMFRLISPEFHQNGIIKKDIEHLIKFKFYKLSCMFFALNGIIKFKTNKYFGILLVLQSFLSYMSDVYTLGNYSKWHIADRYFAVCMAIYHIYNLKTIHSYIINILLFYTGHKYLSNSQNLYDIGDIKFLDEHIKWHIIAAMTIYIG